jgi:hypothetical protein
MFSRRELTALASEKAVLLERIDANRMRCVEAAARVARPFVWLDEALARWRRVPQIVRFVAFPIASFLLKRWFASRSRRRKIRLRPEEAIEPFQRGGHSRRGP